jgi:hypothetical protein
MRVAREAFDVAARERAGRLLVAAQKQRFDTQDLSFSIQGAGPSDTCVTFELCERSVGVARGDSAPCRVDQCDLATELSAFIR